MFDVKARREKARARPIEVGLARLTGSSPAVVRFWAARLVLELTLNRPLDKQEASKLASRVYASFPRIGTRYVLWPEEADSR